MVGEEISSRGMFSLPKLQAQFLVCIPKTKILMVGPKL
jgi:hypothetical protein